MIQLESDQPVATLKDFKGTFSRGPYEICPPDHLTSCFNCIFSPNGITIREPATVQSTISGRTTISFAVAKVASGARLLTLNSDGSFYDETTATLLASGVTADDFTVLNVFGRTYISFKLDGKARVTDDTYFYDGTHFLAVAGIAPSTPTTLADVNSGIVSAGVHKVAVSFQTITGFLTPPSPLASITSDGTHDIELSAIPTGGSNIVARVLLMTAANQLELFFVPGGTIPDNTTTTATINVADSSLLSSADYLNDVMQVIPSCTAIRFYHGRLVYIGQDPFPDNLLVSNVSDPETVNKVTGIVNIPVDYGLNTTNTGEVIRDTLYAMKPNATYSIQDNGGDPSTWTVSIIDSGIGAWDNGVSQFSSSMSGSDVLDSCFVVNRRGLLQFDGTYHDVPLTYKIQAIWDLISSDNFFLCQIAHDIWKKRVYIAVPLAVPSHVGADFTPGTNVLLVLLMMDYQNGIDPESVRWSTWTSFNFGSGLKKITVENFTLSYPPPTGVVPIYQLAFCNGTNTIYKVTNLQTGQSQSVTLAYFPDLSPGPSYNPVAQYMITAPVTFPGKKIACWVMIDINAFGYGTNTIKAFTTGSSSALTGSTGIFIRGISFANLSYFAQNIQTLINITSEQIQILIANGNAMPSNLMEFVQLVDIKIYGNKMYDMRPALASI